jgi:Leucine-rich repeat (LRR) protein
MKFFLVTFFVATLIDRSWSQTCRKEKGYVENGIEIHDCDTASFKKLLESFDLEKVVSIYAGRKGNSFPVIDNKFFDKNNNLTQLTLSQCKIETVEENTFSNLKVLSFLDLSGNKIKMLDENTFRELASLTGLNLNGNQIETIPEKLFEGNGKLEWLLISSNKIKQIPIGVFDALTELKWLLMGGNELEIIHRSTFKQNKKLERLSFYNNKIHGIAERTLEGLRSLTELDLSNNTCINKKYESKSSINLDQVSTDLETCHDNYENFLRAVFNKSPESVESPQAKSSSYLIIISISTILSISGVITIFFFIQKTKKVFKELKERQEFELKKRESCHYYSQPDTPAQIEHAQWQELERELKSE